MQADHGVLPFLASDGLGRPLAALLLSDVPPPREELEKKERGEKTEGSKEERVNDGGKAGETKEDKETREDKEDKEDKDNVLKAERGDIGLKERLELATGLEVEFFWHEMRSREHFHTQVSPFTTLHLGLYLCLAGR